MTSQENLAAPVRAWGSSSSEQETAWEFCRGTPVEVDGRRAAFSAAAGTRP